MGMGDGDLRKLILSEIRSNGPIPFERFMELALYTPGIGYYLREVPVIGKDGDFFTASHLGSIFGLLLSRHILRVWHEMGAPEDFHIVEIGPGMGYLAHDILTAIRDTPLISHLSYHMVELNPYFTAVQQERLKHLHSRLFWAKDISDIPYIRGVIICNEILDAFPVKLFEIKNGEVMEVHVDAGDNGELMEVLNPAGRNLLDYLETFAPWIRYFDDYRSEANLRIKDWLREIRKILESGILILIDYGYTSEEYYDPSRNRGTLMCYFRHRAHESPYVNIGEQDITAHVNFTAVSKWAEEAGFKVLDYTTQQRYLLSLSDEELLEKLYHENPAYMTQFKTLVLPQAMGGSHKVMILTV